MEDNYSLEAFLALMYGQSLKVKKVQTPWNPPVANRHNDLKRKKRK